MAALNYDCLNDKSLNETIQHLSYLFRRFNFPDGVIESSVSSETDYLHYARTLFGLDDSQLIQLAEETAEEYELRFSMDDNDTSDGFYLYDFTQRLKKAVEERWQEMDNYLTDHSQSDDPAQRSVGDVPRAIPASQRTFQPALSFSSTLQPSQASATQDYFDDDEDWPFCSQLDSHPPLISPTTPSASMSRMVLVTPTSPARKRKHEEIHVTSFVSKLQNDIPNLPVTPQVGDYVFGELPFEIDWEVWRIDRKLRASNSLDAVSILHNARDLMRLLRENSDKPKIIWSTLRRRVAAVQASALGENGMQCDDGEPVAFKMPESSSPMAWKIIAEEGWYSGKVHLKLNFVWDTRERNYILKSQPMCVSTSRRAYRKFGGDRFVTVSIPLKTVYEQKNAVLKFLQQSLPICERTYHPFFLKRGQGSGASVAVHYFATHGAGLVGKELTLDQLYEWLLSINKNRNAQASKLWDRISLSLSSTKPTVTFAMNQIRLVPDEHKGGECLTDGCAKASPAVFREIWRSGVLGIESTPTAVQGRIGGAKGVWFVDPEADQRSDEMWIEIRDSQLKYKYDPVAFRDEKLRTLDVVKWSTFKPASSLNNQLIGILSDRGVPTRVFAELLKVDLDENIGVVNKFLDNPIFLRDWIADKGRIYNIRCLGSEYTETSSGEDAVQEPGCITYDEAGKPTMPHEVCVSMLEAGFIPKENMFLWNTLKHVLIKACDNICDDERKLHISVGKSTTLVCIADELDVLEENQVSIRFGNPFLDEETGKSVSYIDGEVLVARNPALLPSDIQKLQAVDEPRLRYLTDVIVFSRKGLRSQVSLLSGGDYDGDTVWICWDDRLVAPFIPAEKSFAEEPSDFLDTYFYQDKRQVSEIAGNADGMTVDSERFLKHGISLSLLDSELGICTDRHRDIVYDRGYSDPTAITLARLASRLVDAPKHGFRLNPKKWTDIQRGLNVRLPEYIRPKGDGRIAETTKIMDILVLKAIPAFRDEVMKLFTRSLNSRLGTEDWIPIDEDIKEFYQTAARTYPEAVAEMRAALSVLEGEWKNFHSKNKHEQALNKDYTTCSPKKGLSRSASRIDRASLDDFCVQYRNLTFPQEFHLCNVGLKHPGAGMALPDKIKAATAYCLGLKPTWYAHDPNAFPWSVGGFRALCDIKANATAANGIRRMPPRAVIEQMYVSSQANHAFARVERERLSF